MVSSSRKIWLKAFAFALIGAFLIAEYALIEHAIKHTFADTDTVCFVCEKADNFQNTLCGSIGAIQLSGTTRYEPQLLFKTRPSVFQGHFHPRAPPASSLVQFV
ncbi:MAG: hypothetical protein ACRESZ_18875 [Methylococcales bacterium]